MYDNPGRGTKYCINDVEGHAVIISVFMMIIYIEIMKHLSDYISEINTFFENCKQEPCIPILEMATISKNAKLGKEHYRIAVHGPASKDRPYPHIHIYKATDEFPFPNFNFEISLVDLLCYDELNLVTMVDKDNGISIKNKNKCSWTGYRKLRDDFEDWLEAKSDRKGDFKNNLDAIIWNYDNEAYEDNALLNYIQDRGKKVLPKYKEYF